METPKYFCLPRESDEKQSCRHGNWNTGCVKPQDVATMPLLVFLPPLLLPVGLCHNVNRFVASFLVPLLHFLHRMLYRVDCAEIKDATTANPKLKTSYKTSYCKV